MNPQLKSIDVQAPCPCSSGLVYKVSTTTVAFAATVAAVVAVSYRTPPPSVHFTVHDL